jgi:hypothetical protein
MADSIHKLDQLSAYLDDRLSGAVRQAVESHLASCADCRARMQSLKEQRALLKAVPLLTPPESFYKEVLAKVEGRSPRPWFAWTWGVPLKLAASVCILFVIVLATRQKERSTVVNQIAAPAALEKAQKPPVAEMAGDEETKSRRKVSPASAGIIAKDVAMQNKKRAETSQERQQSVLGTKRLDAPFEARKHSAGKVATPVLQARDPGGAATQGSYFYGSKAEAPRSVLKESRGFAPASPPAAKLSDKKVDRARGAALKFSEGSNDSALASNASAVAGDWKGAISGITTFRTVAIRTPEEWKALWAEHVQPQIPAPPAPEVDFDRYTLVAVFAGEKPSTGYSVAIQRIQFQPDRVIVHYAETAPPRDAAVGAALTQPYEIRLIPKTGLPVQFRQP